MALSKRQKRLAARAAGRNAGATRKPVNPQLDDRGHQPKPGQRMSPAIGFTNIYKAM